MNERFAPIQTGLLAGILVVLVVIAIKPSGQTEAATQPASVSQATEYTQLNPMPVRLITGPTGDGAIDVHVVQYTNGTVKDQPFKVEVTNPSCGHTMRGGNSGPFGGFPDDGPCLVNVAP